MNAPPRTSGQAPPARLLRAGGRALVTGGAGFIGSHLVEHLLERGLEVTVCDDCSTGTLDNLAKVSDRIALVRGDLAEMLRGPLAEAGFDAIFHLAASVGVQRILERPIESIESNMAQTAAVLRYAADHGPRPDTPAAFLFASSSEVYGKSTKVPFSEEDDRLYGPTTIHRWSYAGGKALGEQLALAHHRQRGLPAVIVRFFNTVGPRQVGRYGMVLPRFVRQALAGEALTVFGSGEQSRCFCDVRDAVPALVRLLDDPAHHGRVYNLGSDRPVTIAQLARTVLEVVAKGDGPNGGMVSVPYSEAYPPGFEDLHVRIPDLTRIREAIGFQQRYALADTIKDIASFVQAYPDA